MYIADQPQSQNIDFRPLFEIRERYERRTTDDSVIGPALNRTDLLSRARVGLSLKTKDIFAKLVYQYAHDLAWTKAKNFAIERSDVIEAYAQANLEKMKITVGRQRITIGRQRLLGELNWNNATFAFDAIKVERDAWSGFISRQGVLPAPSRNLFLAGASLKDKAGLTSAILKTDKFRGVEKGRLTLTRESQTTLGPVALEYQLAGQIGHEAGKEVTAWAATAQATHKLTKKSSLFAKSSVASGGRSASHVSTFDTLYPSAHDQIGLMDTTGWSNVAQICVGINHVIDSRQTMKFQFMDISLMNSKDGWYGPLGGLNTRGSITYLDPTGVAGRHVGTEIDFDYQFKVNKDTSFGAGMGVFFPGRFVKRIQGGSASNQFFGYVMVSTKF